MNIWLAFLLAWATPFFVMTLTVAAQRTRRVMPTLLLLPSIAAMMSGAMVAYLNEYEYRYGPPHTHPWLNADHDTALRLALTVFTAGAGAVVIALILGGRRVTGFALGVARAIRAALAPSTLARAARSGASTDSPVEVRAADSLPSVLAFSPGMAPIEEPVTGYIPLPRQPESLTASR